MSTLEMASMRLPYTNIFLLHAYHKNHEMAFGYVMYSNKNIIRSNDKYPQSKNSLNKLLNLTHFQHCVKWSFMNGRTSQTEEDWNSSFYLLNRYINA